MKEPAHVSPPEHYPQWSQNEFAGQDTCAVLGIDYRQREQIDGKIPDGISDLMP